MQLKQNKHISLYLSIFLLTLLYLVAWPFYKYVLDPDGACYAAIAEQYAKGHVKDAINNVWSPLHEWLIIPFIKLGVYAPYAFKYSNLFIGSGILLIIHSFLIKSDLEKSLQTCLLLCLTVILSYCIWHELAADLPFCLIVLIYMKITYEKNFHLDHNKNMLAGFIGGLGYLTKAIGLPFFLIHFSLIHFWNDWSLKGKGNYIKGLILFFIVASPWIFILYKNHGIWSYSSAGALNMSWQLDPAVSKELTFLSPPHKYAFSHWENPWYDHSVLHSPFDSFTNFIKLTRQILYNFQEYLKAMLRISFLSISISFISLINLMRTPTKRSLYIFIGIFLLPTGYIMYHYDDRYLWPVSIFILIAGTFYVRHFFSMYSFRKSHRFFIWLLYFGSFLIEPINQLKDSVYKDKEMYELANLLHLNGIEHSFTSNKKNIECGVIGYINRIKYYAPNQPTNDIQALLSKAKKENIKYCLFFYKNKHEKECVLNAISGNSYKSVKNINHQTIAFEL